MKCLRSAILPLILLTACSETAPLPGAPRDGGETTFEGLAAARERMIEEQVKRIGATSERVVAAFRRVPRHGFLPRSMWDAAYADRALRQEDGETLTAPDLTGAMLQALDLDEGSRVLECGTRSGWLTSLLAACAGEVYSADARPEAIGKAMGALAALGFRNVRLRAGDPIDAWLAKGPFDAIVVNGAVPHIPKRLYEALVPGGRILAPVGGGDEKQTLILCVRGDRTPVRTRGLLTVRFGPLAR